MTQIHKNQVVPAERPVYFDDFITRDNWKRGKEAYPMQFASLPATNIYENADFFIIELVAPGLSHEMLEISTEDSVLDVRYEYRDERYENMQTSRDWHREYRTAPFRRQFELNAEVADFSELQVSSNNGVVRFEIPKREDFRGKVLPAMPFSPN